MSRLKKILVGTVVVIGLLAAAAFVYKKWQFSQIEYSQPERETIAGLQKLQTDKIKGGVLYLPKDKAGYRYLS